VTAFLNIPLQSQLPRVAAKGKALLNAIYPPRCMICQEMTLTGANLCPDCWADTGFITGAICNCCGTPLPGDPAPDILCDRCLATPPPWESGRAAVIYAGAGRRAVLAFKHGDRLDMARPLAGWLARAGAELLPNADLIVPVPLHWRRFVRRRYNQSAELARHLGVLAGLPAPPDMLLRKRATNIQEGMDRAQRFANQSGAFLLNRHHDPVGKRVILVDDVMTSGATLTACTDVLHTAGVQHVSVMVLARVALGPQATIYSD